MEYLSGMLHVSSRRRSALSDLHPEAALEKQIPVNVTGMTCTEWASTSAKVRPTGTGPVDRRAVCPLRRPACAVGLRSLIVDRKGHCRLAHLELATRITIAIQGKRELKRGTGTVICRRPKS